MGTLWSEGEWGLQGLYREAKGAAGEAHLRQHSLEHRQQTPQHNVAPTPRHTTLASDPKFSTQEHADPESAKMISLVRRQVFRCAVWS
jgi:hypothetical protein